MNFIQTSFSTEASFNGHCVPGHPLTLLLKASHNHLHHHHHLRFLGHFNHHTHQHRQVPPFLHKSTHFHHPYCLRWRQHILDHHIEVHSVIRLRRNRY